MVYAIESSQVPHMSQMRGRYAKATAWREVRIGGCTYKFRTCCSMCAEAIRANLKRYFDAKKAKMCPNCLSMRHRTTVKVVHKASLYLVAPKHGENFQDE
jgi:hypothetical protein